MNDFELGMVHCLNNFFEDKHLKGFAYRLKQSKFSSQYVDILVDSLDPRYYLAVECKSLKGKKIYFTQHFHEDKNHVHQVDQISEFLSKTGRRGYLAVEFRGGPGHPKEAYLMPWNEIQKRFGNVPGISIDEFREWVALSRSSETYTLDSLYPKELDNK